MSGRPPREAGVRRAAPGWQAWCRSAARAAAASRRWIVFSLAGLLLFSGCILDEGLGKAPEGWVALAPMLTARSDPASTVVDGKIYVFGGLSASGVTLNTVEEYDPALDEWTARASMPTANYGRAACALGQAIYVMGGSSTDLNVQKAMEAYDTASDTWTTRGALPEGCFECGCGVVAGTLYAMLDVAQQGGGANVPTPAAYDAAGDTWSLKTDYSALSGSRSGVGVTGFDGQLLILGGFVGGDTGGGNSTSSVLAYDPATDAWSEFTALPSQANNLEAAADDSLLFAVGGFDSGNQDSSTSPVKLYELDTGAWSKVAALPVRQVLSHRAVVVDGKVYVMGGQSQTSNGSGAARDTVLSWDPAKRKP